MDNFGVFVGAYPLLEERFNDFCKIQLFFCGVLVRQNKLISAVYGLKCVERCVVVCGQIRKYFEC